jgi:small subunit ribosomal protein S1
MSDEVKDRTGKGEKSFAELFESYGASRSEDIRVGDKVRGEIISIGRDSVFIDTGSKIDGVVDKGELLGENGEMPYKEGDILELYVVSRRENEVRLSKAISGIGGQSLLQDAFDRGIPVEGKVKGPCKGGFHVEIMHLRAFCPLSQVDLHFVESHDEYVGNTYQFLITQFEEDGGNIVVSRRELLHRELEKEREKFQGALAVGAELAGKVTRLVPYGAFVELFPGIEGMVHISELSWSRVEKPDEVLTRGDKLKFKVIGIEEGESAGHLRIGLSIKQLTGDPWDTVGERFHEGDRATGKVTRCAEFGAFVEIAPGIEGMVHISELSYTKRVLRPEDVVKVGKVVPVVVKEVDAVRRRISLSIRDAEGDPWMDIEEKYHVGQAVQGTIEKKEQFGYFVALEPGITGLFPRSNVAKSHNPRSIEKLRQGDPIEVVIEGMRPDERRITLGPGDARDEQDWRSFARDADKPLGSLGEKLHQALKSKKVP